MKIKESDYRELESDIRSVSDIISKADALKLGWSETRYRWALYHMVNSRASGLKWRRLYDYLNDSHIDTALKNIVGGLK
jgi:hypothetical protein